MKKITLFVLSLILVSWLPATPKSKSEILVHASCLETYLTFCDHISNILAASTAHCVLFFDYDPDLNLQCQFYAHDVYVGMHAVADAAYDRCVGIPVAVD